MTANRKHWTDRMFVERGEIYIGTLESLMGRAEAEVDWLSNVFSGFQVPERGRVLDLACGIGRHSIALARRGYRVTGVDISPIFISRADEIAEEAGVSDSTEFLIGDMRQVGRLLEEDRGGFNAVISLFTSIGYWDEETDMSIFTQLYELTSTGGVFVLDTTNRDWLVRNFQATGYQRWTDGRIQMQERRLDLESSRMFNIWRWYSEEGEDLKHLETIELDHRVYSLHELKRLVEGSGWSYKVCYGGYASEPFTTDCSRMILVAKKEGPSPFRRRMRGSRQR